MQRNELDETAEQVSNPFEQWATSTDEFLEEIGGKAEETTEFIKDTLYLLSISRRWICSFVLFALFLLTVPSMWCKCFEEKLPSCRKEKRNELLVTFTVPNGKNDKETQL